MGGVTQIALEDSHCHASFEEFLDFNSKVRFFSAVVRVTSAKL